jgi:hypothetical protein
MTTTSSLPPILYKYRKWNDPDEKRIITNTEVFFGSPCVYQIEHEFNLPVDYDLTDEELHKWFSNDISLSLTPEEQKRQINNRITFSRDNNLALYNEDERKKSQEEFQRRLCEELRIFCTSISRENDFCWRSYASGNSGFCIGLNTEKIFKTYEKQWGGRIVKYFPKDMSPPETKLFSIADDARRKEDFENTIFCLKDLYSMEEEFRLIKLNSGNNCVTIDKEIIEEINLSPFISTSNREEIIQIVRHELPHVKIFDTKIVLGKYHFELIT